MNLALTDKSVLITGASRGIGAAVALAFAREGCDIGFTHWGDAEGARSVVREIRSLGRRAHSIEADAAEAPRAETVFSETEQAIGQVRILVANAGVSADAVSWKMTETEWDRVVAVNLKGCFNYGRIAARRFRERPGGKIVNIASINGLRGRFGQINYAASKGGVVALTRALARELGRYDVNVNAVAPGLVETELTRTLPEEFPRAAREESCLGRLGRVEEIADLVVFLASDRARHITGTCVRIDGGQLS